MNIVTTITFQNPILPFTEEKEATLIDLHVHSNCSFDGFLSVGKLLKTAKLLNIGLAICDHNEIQGAQFATKQKEVFVIPAIEVTVQNGTHLLFYFKTIKELEAFYKENVAPYKKNKRFIIDLPPSLLLEKARRFETLITAPHPFATFRGGIQKAIAASLVNEEFAKSHLDLIEGANGMTERKQNEKAIAWAKKINKPIIGGSDGHLLGQIGTVVTKIAGQSREEIFENLKNPKEIIGREMTGIQKAMIKIQKESKLILRPGGFKILTGQIKRSFKK